ncbi:substrate-binding domain-containing protein [Geomicrobium sp. JCM 19037]|uniref:substrate-binding domain-containing protein n=1 Tax=Geomicrobium sp. JCM 19037 TaxID=1460634 RepID=UPI00187C07CC|nr:substrate-binding domain-containing protein [Geomicrobium sp. JCM 19037]
MPKILRDFRKIYPNVEFQVLSGWSEEIYKKMTDRDVHVGFIRGDYPWRGRREVLFEETLCVASTQPFGWNDLHKMTQINYKTDRKLIALVEDWWNENFDHPPNVGLRVDQVDTCKEMIINGLGYGIVPDLIVDDDPSIYKKTLKNPDGELSSAKHGCIMTKIPYP